MNRFWCRVNKLGPIHPVLRTRCWIWIGARSSRLGNKRYGVIRLHGSQWYAHRLSWALHNGFLIGGSQVLHHCDNQTCVNPAHLFLGSPTVNREDCVSKGRQAKGERVNTAKLTESQVLEIRRRYKKGVSGHGLKPLALEFGVSFSTIRCIVKGVSWFHLLGGTNAHSQD